MTGIQTRRQRRRSSKQTTKNDWKLSCPAFFDFPADGPAGVRHAQLPLLFVANAEHHVLGFEGHCRRTNERKVKFFNQTAMWHGLLLQQEFKLKFLSCLDGYLAAVDSENPVLVYLSARYLLELMATIAYLDFELREALKANAGDWEARGVRFVTTLCRGRYASSDPKMADVLADVRRTEEGRKADRHRHCDPSAVDTLLQVAGDRAAQIPTTFRAAPKGVGPGSVICAIWVWLVLASLPVLFMMTTTR